MHVNTHNTSNNAVMAHDLAETTAMWQQVTCMTCAGHQRTCTCDFGANALFPGTQ